MRTKLHAARAALVMVGLALAVLAATLFAGPAVAAEEKVLHVYNWSEYVPQSVLDRFTKETGIKVVYTTYESNEAMYAKIKLLKGVGYDVIVPSTYFISMMRDDGLLAKIDKTRLKNFKNLSPKVLDQPFDPGNEYSVPYMWGSSGLMVNKKVVDPASITSWNDLNRPEFAGKVILSDDQRDSLGVALKALGYSVNSTKEAEIKAAYDWLKKLLPAVRVFDVTASKQAFISEEVAAGLIWNGDAYIAASENKNLVYVYPKEGVPLWVDSLAIPVGAKHKDNAHKFIDFLLRPEVAKECVEEYNYSTPNVATQKILAPELAKSRITSPSDADLKNAEFTNSVGNALEIYEKYWEMLKTGS